MLDGVSGETGMNFSRSCEQDIGCESFPLNHWTVASGHALALHQNPTLYQLVIVILGASVLGKESLDSYMLHMHVHVTHKHVSAYTV